MTVQHSYTLLKTRCIQLIRKARRTATSGIKFTAFMLITLLMSASAAWSDTNVSGTISTDTTWTLADSPYIVTGSITVQGTDGADATTTLTIEPGVEVRVNAYCAIYIGSYYSSVAGALVAQGTATDPILFTSNLPSPAPGNWQGLFFYRGVNNDITVMDHCIVEYGGYGYGAFYINNASPLIQNTTIRNNINTAVYTAFGSPTLQSNTLSNNTSYGVHIASGSPIISGNTFSNNGNYDIYATATTDGTITGNTINNGIYIASGNTAGITGNTINYNNSYPVRLNAADIGELVSGNTLNNVDSQSHIQVTAGTIARDAVWKKFNYHLVNGNISVQGADGADATTTLTIEPGAQIRMNGMYAIYVGNYYSSVAGALRAVGTEDQPILFTSNLPSPAPGNWQGLCFYSGVNNDITVMDHCIVEYGGNGYGALYINNASPTIQNTQIRHSNTAGIYIYGNWANAAPIDCNTFSNNQNGIYISNNSPPEMHHNSFLNNTSYGVYYTGAVTLNAEGNWWGDPAGPNTGGDAVYGNVDADPWSSTGNQCDSTLGNYPPNEPVGPSPANNAVHVNVDSSLTLNWNCSDPNSEDTVVFDLYWGASADSLSLVAQDIAEPTYTMTDLLGGVTYLWQITARDNGGLETAGPVWSFTSEGDPPDLIISDLNTSPAGGMLPNSNVTLFVAVTNNSSTGPVVDSFVTEIRIDGNVIGVITTDSFIQPGDTLQLSHNWIYTGGDPVITVITDNQANVAESDEGNNQLTGQLSAFADISAPMLTGHTPDNGDLLQQIEQITVTLSDTQSAIDDAAVTASFAVTNAVQVPVSVSITESSDTFALVPTALPVADGSYQVSLTASDIHGNSQAYSFGFTIDSIPPAKPTITGATVTSGTIQPRPVQNTTDSVIAYLEGTREANTSMWVNGVQYTPIGSGSWSIQIDLITGPNALEVYCLDSAGNQSESEWVDISCNAADGIVYEYDASGRLTRVRGVNQ